MDYRNTTILPTDDPAAALAILSELLHEQPFVILVVVGTDPEAIQLGTRASRLAEVSHSRWHVVWSRQPQQIWDYLRALPARVGLPADPAEVRCVGLGWSDEVMAVVLRSEPVPDLAELLLLLTKLTGGVA